MSHIVQPTQIISQGLFRFTIIFVVLSLGLTSKYIASFPGSTAQRLVLSYIDEG